MSAKIQAIFIDRKNKKVIGEAQVMAPPPDPISAFQAFLNTVNPLSQGPPPRELAPTPSSLNYSIDLFRFTDSFDFQIALAPDEDFNVRSHDFVEFVVFENETTKRQIGVGVIESITKETTATKRILKANGRDLLGQFITIPFNVQLKKEPLTMRRFVDRMIRGSYLEEYLNFRKPSLPKISDLGSFQLQMLFMSDLEQKKAQIAQQYAELAINLIYMNHQGQVELLGRAGTFGSTAPARTRSPIGILRKGENVESFIVLSNFTGVFSEFTLFYSSGEAIQDINTNPGSKFINTDPRVSGHIFQPEFRTFNTTDLVTLGGAVNFTRRIRDVAKSLIRKSNRDLNSVVATVSSPFFSLADGTERAFHVGDLFVLQSNEREFTSRARPNGTDTVQMILTGINYSQNETSLGVQLRFHEVDTLL